MCQKPTILKHQPSHAYSLLGTNLCKLTRFSPDTTHKDIRKEGSGSSIWISFISCLTLVFLIYFQSVKGDLSL